MTIFETLRNDHDKQRDLMNKLTDTSGDVSERRLLFEKLKKKLTAHAAAEERHFYKHLMDDERTTKKARHSIAEHHEIDELIEKLEDTEMSSPQWLKYAKDLQHQLEHHLNEEEHEIFQMAGKVLTEKQKENLGTKFKEEMH